MLKRLIPFCLFGAVCFVQADVNISLKSLPQSQVLFGGFRNADHSQMQAYALSMVNDTDKEIEIFPKDFDVSLMQAEDIFSLHFPQYHIWKFFTAVMASYFSYLGSIPFAIFSITDYADSRKLSRESQNIDKIAKLRQLAEIEKIYHRDKMLLDISGHVMFAQQNEYINYDDFYNAGLVHIENKKQRLINEVTAKDWWVVKSYQDRAQGLFEKCKRNCKWFASLFALGTGFAWSAHKFHQWSKQLFKEDYEKQGFTEEGIRLKPGKSASKIVFISGNSLYTCQASCKYFTRPDNKGHTASVKII